MNIHCFISSVFLYPISFFLPFFLSFPFFCALFARVPSWFIDTDFDFTFILCMLQSSIQFEDFHQPFPVQWSWSKQYQYRCCCSALYMPIIVVLFLVAHCSVSTNIIVEFVFFQPIFIFYFIHKSDYTIPCRNFCEIFLKYLESFSIDDFNKNRSCHLNAHFFIDNGYILSCGALELVPKQHENSRCNFCALKCLWFHR